MEDNFNKNYVMLYAKNMTRNSIIWWKWL